ncbi:MAG: glycosyl hydrolase [Acidobacteriia bacterium]|nr:glycosyl hydrolase [Terriglobia bacterium]
MLRSSHRVIAPAVFLALALTGAWSLRLHAARQAGRAQTGSGIDPMILNTFRWRSIGPERGGRSIAISGVKGRPKEGYFGATGGGLWKTIDGGENWTPVTDGQIHSSSVGAVAVSDTNPDLVFIGMGESCIRGDVMEGDGVYKSTDAGKTWTHVAFPDARVISKIRIHPLNPDIVFVAAFGRLSIPSEERGVYKSTDGGKTWRRTLFKDNKTGAVDISIDQRNPKVMFAALWEAYRMEYTMSSGGPGSGLYKSTDGGETWTDITRNPGLPQGVDGKIGVSVSGADSNRVYAIIENANGGLFSSDDAGATWKSVNEGRNIRQRAFYYTHVTADPKNRDIVYVQNVGTFKSTDGGKTLLNFAGGDSHDLWIDPDDTNHIMHASDSGGAVTYAGGGQWSARDFPTGQFYHVVTTRHVPYHVCGAQQDSSTICVPSNTGLGGGGGRGGAGGGRGGRGSGAPATYGAGGAEPGYIAPDPKDPDVFFAGGNNGSFMTRINRKTGENREVGVYPRMFSGAPSSALVERVQWTYPIIFSPVDSNILYSATQHVWKTTTGGQTWEKISGDLTRHDPKTMGDSGGPITHDMNSPEVYATVFALGPGKTDVNVVWAGSDDGLIHVTRDGGKNWANVTPKGMPDFGRVSIIDASAFDAGTAYVAVKRPLLGDLAPYIFRTHDFGKTWTKIVNGIGPLEYVHAVREDPTRKGLLYAGTQDGFYISYDDGDTWLTLSLNLPDTQISDIAVEANDIAISTHGRGFYVLDHVAPLRQYTPAVASAGAYLFKPDDAIRSAGGATIIYLLRQPAQSLTIDILDSKGQVIRSFSGSAGRGAGEGPGAAAGGRGRGSRGSGGSGASMAAGLNTVSWDLRYPSATSFPGMILWGGSVTGPAAAPGTYQVRMTVDGETQMQPLFVKRHPLYTDVTDADLKEQFDLAIRIRDKVSEANNAVIQIRSVKSQVVDRLSKPASDAKLKAAGDPLIKNLSAVEEEIYQVRNQSGQDPLNFPIKLNNRLASLLSMVNHGDGKPIGNAQPVFADLSAELKVLTDKLQQVLEHDLAAFNAETKRLSLDPVRDK